MAENPPADPAVTCDDANRPGLTGSQRQARHRARLRQAGLVAVTVVIPVHAAPEFQLAAEAMRLRPHLRLGPLRDPISGRLVFAKGVLAL